MTTDPRLSAPRSSFAIAMRDYTFIRPGVAVTVSAATLVVALVFGLDLIASLRQAAATVRDGARSTATLHRYNAGFEVWRRMATSADPAYRRPEVVAQRDSIRDALRDQIAGLATSTRDPVDQDLARTVLDGLTTTDDETTTKAREAMIVLLARQDAALFGAAAAAQRGVLLAAVLVALTILAAGMLVVPMAWLYVRYKRGATIDLHL
jgi:prophage DNA circulation protein